MPTSTLLCIVVAVFISAALVAGGQHPEFWNVQKAVTLAPLPAIIPDHAASQMSRSSYPLRPFGCWYSSPNCLNEFDRGGAEWSIDHVTRGDAYAMRKQFDDAIAEYGSAILLKPNVAEPYFRRGLMFFAKNDGTRAIADFSAAIRLDATNALAYKDRGEAYTDKGEYDRAIADFNDAIRLNPNLAAAFAGRGRAYEAKGNGARAQADFAEASRLGEVLRAPAPVDRPPAPSRAQPWDPDIAPR
jgi:tetratricopeptide (TPR) repeat protein